MIYEFFVKKNDEFEQFIPQPILSFFPKWETLDIYYVDRKVPFSCSNKFTRSHTQSSSLPSPHMLAGYRPWLSGRCWVRSRSNVLCCILQSPPKNMSPSHSWVMRVVLVQSVSIREKIQQLQNRHLCTLLCWYWCRLILKGPSCQVVCFAWIPVPKSWTLVDTGKLIDSCFYRL